MSAPSSGWRWIAVQSSSVSVRPRSATRSDSAKWPMSCSRPAVCASSHSSSGHPDRPRDVAREPRDGGGVPRGALVADVERAHQSGEHAPGERHVLLGAVARLVERGGPCSENANTAASAKAIPREADLEVDAGAGDARAAMLSPALGRYSSSTSRLQNGSPSEEHDRIGEDDHKLSANVGASAGEHERDVERDSVRSGASDREGDRRATSAEDHRGEQVDQRSTDARAVRSRDAAASSDSAAATQPTRARGTPRRARAR